MPTAYFRQDVKSVFWGDGKLSNIQVYDQFYKKINMPTPFPPNKTAEELKIDKRRKFVVVSNEYEEGLKVGDIVTMSGCAPFAKEPGATFQNEKGDEETMFWRELAYADVPEPEAYVPAVGDRVSLEGVVRSVSVSPGWFSVLFDGSQEECVFEDDECKHAKLLSRLKAEGWTVKGADVKEMTVEEVSRLAGCTVKIVEKKAG